MTKSILLVGVGGQGTILASKLLTTGLMEVGYDVKMSEIHGMSQRGGSVSSQVRYGKTVESPVIELGGADVLISFEKMEALRWMRYLKPGGIVIVNDYEMPSMPIISGDAAYPHNAIKEIAKIADTRAIKATSIAIKLGNAKVTNMVLLGAIISSMGLEEINWDDIILRNVKTAFVELNQTALRCGMDYYQSGGTNEE